MSIRALTAPPGTLHSLRRPLLAHPSTVFVGVWTITLGLALWGWVPAFTEYTSTALLIGSLLILSNVFGAFVAALMTGRRPITNARPLVYHGRNAILAVWAAISIGEIALAGGLPILWLVSGSGQTYEDFGIPTIHGFANAMWLFLSFTQCLRIFDSARTKKDFMLATVLLAWPVLVVSRALFTILLLQIVFFYLITTTRRMSFVTARMVVLAALFALAFGYAGDVRAPEFSIIEALGFDADEIRFAALLWIYSYVVSPVATLALNWQNSIPTFELLPSNTLANLLPSAVRSALGMDTGFEGYLGLLAHDAFNVSTAFLAPYLDWGAAGMFGMASMIGWFGHIVWRATLRSALKLPLLCAFNAFVALTIFTNQFIQLTPLLLLALLTFLAREPRVRHADRQANVTPTLKTT